MSISKIAYLLISLISVVYILSIGQSIFIPLVFAVLLWILVREIKSLMDKISFLKNKVPSWLKTLLASIFLFGLLGGASRILIISTRTLAKSHKMYRHNVNLITEKLNSFFNIDINEILSNQISELDFAKLFSATLNSLTDLLGSAFMIIIYALFIFLEESNFQQKLKLIITKEEQHKKVIKVLNKLEVSVNQYLGLKILVSLMTGVLSFLTLYFIGIDGPAFWAFLIFLLNFIPTIGSLIATIFPAIFSILQFGDFLPAVLIALIVGGIQVVVGNVIEPKLMGNSLNISSLVAIIALVFWGAIWGVTGMLLSIPITVIILIILSQFDQTKSIAVMLSENGKI